MSFASWITGVAAAVWNFMLPLLKSKAQEIIADKQVQALAYQAVVVAAQFVQNSGDERFDRAVRSLRNDMKDAGREIALGFASVVIQAAYEKLKVEDPKLVGKAP